MKIVPRGLRLPKATKGWSMGVAPQGKQKKPINQQLTTASTLFRIEAVVSYSHTPGHSGGILT